MKTFDIGETEVLMQEESEPKKGSGTGIRKLANKKLVLASIGLFGLAVGAGMGTIVINRNIIEKYTKPYVEMALRKRFGNIQTIESIEKNYEISRTFAIKITKEDIEPIAEFNVYTVPLDKVLYTAKTTNKNFPKIPILADRFPEAYEKSKEFLTKTEYTAIIPSKTRLGFNMKDIMDNLDNLIVFNNNKIYITESPTVEVTSTQPFFGKHKVIDEKTGLFGDFHPAQIISDLDADQKEVVSQVSKNNDVQKLVPLRAKHFFDTYMRGLIDKKYPEFRKYDIVTNPIKFDWKSKKAISF